MNKFIVAVVLFGAVLGDGGHHAPAPATGSGYAAPQDAYASPAAEYAAPSYEAPASSYGAPTYEQEYAAPAYEPATGYEVSAPAYGAPAADAGLDFDLSKLTELLPLFVAVFAAIIIAQLVAPLFGMIFNAKLGIFGGIFAPLAQTKVNIANLFLNPFNIAIADCTPANPANGICANNAVNVGQGRSFNDFNVIDMIDMAAKIYENFE